ncbi:Transmembrane protein 186 [Sergentomyia squamirostris]
MILRLFCPKSLQTVNNGSFMRFISSSGIQGKRSAPENQIDNDRNTDWKTIYKMPVIRLFSVANRIKIYQGALTALFSPLSYALEASSQLPEGTFFVTITLGVTGFLSLTLFSALAKNVVGFIYLNTAEDRLKLAYVGFLGERREAEYPVKDVIGADELPPSKYKYYYPLAFRNTKTKFMVFHKGGSIENSEKFSSIFGEDLV